MDPQTALDNFRAAYASGDYHMAHDYAVGLLGWIRNGGAMPTIDVGSFIALLDCTTNYLDMCAHREHQEDTTMGVRTVPPLGARGVPHQRPPTHRAPMQVRPRDGSSLVHPRHKRAGGLKSPETRTKAQA